MINKPQNKQITFLPLIFIFIGTSLLAVPALLGTWMLIDKGHFRRSAKRTDRKLSSSNFIYRLCSLSRIFSDFALSPFVFRVLARFEPL